jgi:hypothetical protein
MPGISACFRKDEQVQTEAAASKTLTVTLPAKILSLPEF